MGHSDPNLLVTYVTDILVSAANETKIKFRKDNSTNDPPWFDKPCRDLKSSIKLLGKKIRRNSNDQNLKTELYANKRELKKIIKKNKIKFKNDLMDQIKQSKNDSKKFSNDLNPKD